MAYTPTSATATFGDGNQHHPGLLPAFESMKTKPKFLSDFLKPSTRNNVEEQNLLPTPLPTSEAAQPPSSPAPQTHHSETAFLTSTPLPSSPIRSQFEDREFSVFKPANPHYKVRIPSNGEPVLVGRSSKSCAFSLRANNKQISRMHLRMWFDQAESIVSAECLGWNGFSVLVDGTKYDVSKGQIINFDLTSDVYLTVCEEKVDVEVEYVPNAKRAKRVTVSPARSPIQRINTSEINEEESETITEPIDSGSKPEQKERKELSPEPVKLSSTEPIESETVETVSMEKAVEPVKPIETIEKVERAELPAKAAETFINPPVEPLAKPSSAPESLESPIEAKHEKHEAMHEKHEAMHEKHEAKHENEKHEKHEKHEEKHEPKRHLSESETTELSNMISNMVAFTHLRTLPFKDIHRANSRFSSLTKQQLTTLLRNIECVGEVKYFDDSKRAAFEYYYMPEKDSDAVRRAAVQSAHGRRSLRSCRKTPKQYLYKPLNLD